MLYTQLRSFHAVASQGGFTAAGGALRIGQPTVTRQVKQLEQHFGVELFSRHGRHVHLTPVGKSLFDITRRIFTLEHEARDLLNAAGGFHSGHLEVGAVGPYHVTEMLAKFHERYPNLSLSVRMGNSQAVLRDLLDFKTDVAILAQIGEDERFHTVHYSEHPLLVFVNTNHPWAQRNSIRLQELEGQNVILREPGSTTRRAIEAAFARAGVSVKAAMEIGSREAIWWAVLQGLGVGIVSEAGFIPHPHLRKLEIADAQAATCAHVVCLAERRDAPVIKAFLDVAVELARTRRPLASRPLSQRR